MSVSPFPWALLIVSLGIVLLIISVPGLIIALLFSLLGMPFWLVFVLVAGVIAFNLKM
jgi:hypothetical protein